MFKTCAKIVPRGWEHGGSTIHSHAQALWKAGASQKLSTILSPAQSALCTQIVHTQKPTTTPVKPHFSALSTPPITTTTIYI